MCHLPTDIADDENIVRAILSPAHVKPGSTKVRHQALRSRAGEDEVSVIRKSHMGTDFCKEKGKEIESGWPKNFFVGLLSATAKKIYECGSTVHDSRAEYCGHAHISHGFTIMPNEPPPADINLALTNRCSLLLERMTYYPDPDPASPGWSGDSF